MSLGCACNSGQEVPPKQETFASRFAPRLEPPVKVGAHRERTVIFALQMATLPLCF